MSSFITATCLIATSAAASFAQQPGKAERPPAAPASVRYKVETVAERLEIPWEIVFDPAGRMLITERPGRVRVYENGKLRPEPLFKVPNVQTRSGGEIGLMGICLHPDYAKNKFVYLSFGHTDGDVRVARYKDTGTTFADETIILQGVPASLNHAGCCIKFGPDKKLYITTGEMFQKDLAQDMMSLGGKTLRLNDDGSVPDDNPFTDRKEAEVRGRRGVRPEIWTLGHRNAQGMDWQPGTGLMFQSEHGPSGEAGRDGDEVNIVERGKNYGWPIIHHKMTKEDLEAPLVEWTPAVAPASGTFYSADRFPEWKGNFLVGALGGLRPRPTPGVIRIVVDGRKYVSQEFLATEFGRIRAVAVGPDGYIYFSTSNRDGRAAPGATDDRIMRIVPDTSSP